MNNNKEGKGRNKVYTDKVLEEIIEQYMLKNPGLIKLVPSKIAHFAQEEFGFEKIRYSQFTNNEKIKKKIDNFNAEHKKITMPNKPNPAKAVRINTDALVEAYYNEPLKLKAALRQFGDKYTQVCKENISRISEINNLNNEIKQIKKEKEKLENEYKELKKTKAEMARKSKEDAIKIAHANRIEKFIRSIDVYNDLLSQSKVDPMDEPNLRLLLSNAGLLRESEVVDIDEYVNQNKLEIHYDEKGYDEVEDEMIEVEDEMTDEDYLSFFEE